ncbi:hypothetical protein ACIP4Y_09320 [Streptomyces sp. NPDC088810]|uniref:hypothetical protein n=1 Tax=Streptomyces sp. NPDC088810 TaxID=3365904 RepID=UPI0037FDB33B
MCNRPDAGPRLLRPRPGHRQPGQRGHGSGETGGQQHRGQDVGDVGAVGGGAAEQGHASRDQQQTGQQHPVPAEPGHGPRGRPSISEWNDTLQRLTGWAERDRVYVAGARAAYDAGHRPESLDA